MTLLSSLPAAPAVWAQAADTGGSDHGIGLLEVLGIYVGIPLAIFLLAALFVYAPSSAKGPRYRPGLGWWAAPVWFNGPNTPVARPAVTAGSTAADSDPVTPEVVDVTGGTGVTGEHSGATAVPDTGSFHSERGGASARW